MNPKLKVMTSVWGNLCGLGEFDFLFHLFKKDM